MLEDIRFHAPTVKIPLWFSMSFFIGALGISFLGRATKNIFDSYLVISLVLEIIAIIFFTLLRKKISKLHKKNYSSPFGSSMAFVKQINSTLMVFGIVLIVLSTASVIILLDRSPLNRGYTSVAFNVFYFLNELIGILTGVIITSISYLDPEPKSLADTNFLETIRPSGQENKTEKEDSFRTYYEDFSSAESKLEFRLYKLIERLIEQNNSIQKQANLNLIIGVTIAFFGIIVLLFVLQLNVKIIANDFVSKFNYISRLSFVLLIELLALFFLKLFKENLNDRKYYQNELTNIELKYVALAASRTTNDPKDLSKVIENLTSTERNFKLNKDESTVNLKQLEMENNLLGKIIDKITPNKNS